MKCNACWRDLEGRAIATTCGHILCTEDAGRIVNTESSCPICDQILSKSNLKPVDVSPREDWSNMVMAGVQPQSIMKAAYKGMAFWIAQKDVEMQATVSKLLQQYRQKCEQLQTKFTEKLEQLHRAYQKAVRKIQMMQQEIESLSKDKEELQEKYAEKSRQKRKLEEMYDSLRNDYEQAKRCAIHPSTNYLQRSSAEDLFASPSNLLEEPGAKPRQDSSGGTDIYPVTPGQANDFWPARRHQRNVFNNIGDPGGQQTQTTKAASGLGVPNRGAPSFAASKSSLFTPVGNPSTALRNLLLSPMKRQPASRLRPQEFT